MNWADWAILAVIGLSMLISLKRGFVKEALSLVVWVGAFIVARIFSFKAAVLLEPYIEVPSIRLAAAFAALFALTLVVGALINYLISKLVEVTGLSGTDRLLGMVFGAARGALLAVIAVALLRHTPIVHDGWWQASTLIPELLVLEEWSFTLFKDLSGYLMNISQ